jgi:putative ABC transport system permease protein
VNVAPAASSSAQPLMRPGALLYLYRRRLRVHAVQELLAGLGVAVAVALVFATLVAAGSVAGSAGEVVHAVTGPASLQLRARGGTGFEERLLARVERLRGVKQAAPLLEQTATLLGAGGRTVTVDLAGADTSLVVLDGLAHTLPTATLSAGGIGLSRTTAQALGIPAGDTTNSNPALPTSTAAPSVASVGAHVSLLLRGRAIPLRVSAVLGPEAFGALSQARVAVMPLGELQRLAGLPGRVTRILVQTKPGAQATVRRQLQALAGGRLDVATANQDVALLRRALRPSDQASGFFAAVSALLGLLFAFNALLLTVPERRRAIADLRLIGTKRSAIVQMFAFQALCLGVGAALVGLAGGYALSHDAFHQSTGYLAEAFTLGARTVVGVQPLLIAFLGGVLATCLASAVPLLDLRHGRALDAVYREQGVPGNTLPARARQGLALGALGLLALTSVLFATAPALALLACALLALATVLAVPLVFAGVLRGAQLLSERRPRMTILPLALGSLRATTVRSLALAATGAVALFGAIALGGARGDLLRGIEGFSHSYAADAPLWVGNPGDNQAVADFQARGLSGRIAQIPGVAEVRSFQGGFLDLGGRRVWIVARPPGGARHVLESQISQGDAPSAIRRLGEGGWIAVSKQIAEEHDVGVGGTLTLPTPSGAHSFTVAATTTNLAWSPGAIFMDSADYSRLWATSAPTALGIQLAPGASLARVQRAIEATLGAGSGLRVTSASARRASIDRLTSEGLGQLGEISTLLLLAAILAMAAALSSAVWQRRASLAGLRLSGARPRRLRLVLLCESALMLGAGALTGVLAGIYGQLVIDAYLAHVTGFPVARFGASLRPLEILALTIAVVLAIAAVPGWLASRVSPTLAFGD